MGGVTATSYLTVRVVRRGAKKPMSLLHVHVVDTVSPSMGLGSNAYP